MNDANQLNILVRNRTYVNDCPLLSKYENDSSQQMYIAGIVSRSQCARFLFSVCSEQIQQDGQFDEYRWIVYLFEWQKYICAACRILDLQMHFRCFFSLYSRRHYIVCPIKRALVNIIYCMLIERCTIEYLLVIYILRSIDRHTLACQSLLQINARKCFQKHCEVSAVHVYVCIWSIAACYMEIFLYSVIV